MIDLMIKNIVSAGEAGKGNEVIPLFYSIFERLKILYVRNLLI